jgi:transcription elongation GreA/GreB family factor
LKKEILNLIIEALRGEEQLLIDAALSAKTAATEVEAKPEHKYDTRGLEQSYLAGAQAKRAIEIKESIQALLNLHLVEFGLKDSIDVTALVQLEGDEGETKYYFLLPERGGIKVNYKKKEIASLSPDSPMAQRLIGKTKGDEIEFTVAGQQKSYSIVSVS